MMSCLQLMDVKSHRVISWVEVKVILAMQAAMGVICLAASFSVPDNDLRVICLWFEAGRPREHLVAIFYRAT
jgi:hypothetical protein